MPSPLLEEHQREWDEWLETRPERVREVAAARPPWHLYKVIETGQHATVRAYDEHEDGSVTLAITAWYPWLPLPVGVFGMQPEDLAVEGEFAAYSPGEDAS